MAEPALHVHVVMEAAVNYSSRVNCNRGDSFEVKRSGGVDESRGGFRGGPPPPSVL